MNDKKETNPKDIAGVAKVSMSAVPANVLLDVAVALTEGSAKYGRHNYRDAGITASVCYDACMRHMMAWWEGQDTDPDSPAAQSHVVKAISALIVLADSINSGMLVDDRPPVKDPECVMRCNRETAAIHRKYVGNWAAKHTQQGD